MRKSTKRTAPKPKRSTIKTKTTTIVARKYNPTTWKSAVMKLVNSQLETKFLNSGGLSAINFNSSIGSPVEFYSIIPPITRASAGTVTGSWQLAENALSPLRISTHFTVCLANVGRTQNLMCHLFIMKHKRIKSFPALNVAGVDARFLKSGQSSETQLYNGFIQDAMQPINTSTFTLLKKYSFPLISNVGLANGDTNIGNAPNTENKSVKKLIYNYYRKAPLKYKMDQSTAPIYPENDAPFWCFGYSKVDGSAPDALVQNVTITTSNQMTFKDA